MMTPRVAALSHTSVRTSIWALRCAQAWPAIVVILLSLAAGAGAAAQPNSKNVLVVYSFADRKNFSAIDDLKSGMRAAIQVPLNFYVENLESRRFDDKDYEQNLADHLISTYRGIKLDLVVADNFPALEFVLKHREEMFPETPIVFFDLDEGWMAQQKRWPGVTGVTAIVDIHDTVDLALRLQPSTDTVAVLFDNSPYGRYWLKRIQAELATRKDRVREVDLVGLSADDDMRSIDKLSPNTIALFQLAIQETTQPAIEVPALTEWVGRRIPTYSIFPWYPVSHEAIGGDSFDGYQQISLVSQVARRVLAGEKPDAIPIVHDNYHSMVVNWRSLARWHLAESSFPPGTRFIFRQPSPWELYRNYILAALAVMIVQAFLITALLWQRLRKRRAETILRESEERFRTLAETTPALIWMCDADGKTTYLNSRRLDYTGAETAAGYGDTWMEYVHPDDQAKVRLDYSNSLADRAPYSCEYRLRRSDGVYRWVFNLASPRVNSDGSFAGFIGSVVDITDQKQAQEVLRGLSGRLIEAQEDERRRIARELHDDICQRLAILSVRLDRANLNGSRSSLDEIRKYCVEIADDVQSLSHQLHSSKLDHLGLAAALRGFCGEFSKQYSVNIDFKEQRVPQQLPQDISLALFRIGQEALRNAVKYSQSADFAVALSGTEEEVLLEVRDGGVGFDLEEVKRNSGLGLLSMQERAHLVHGSVSVESQPGAGTRVVAVVPVAAIGSSGAGIEDNPVASTTG
jgi:PAS domain S-box-containing protein